jgi:hypothetical protein
MPIAIVISADPAQPCRIGWLPVGSAYPRRFEELVDGPLVTAAYDPDASLWVNDVGVGVLPINLRATTYVREHSAASRRRPIPSDYLLYGDVVLVGSTTAGDVDVPARSYRLLASPPVRSKPDPPGRSRLPGRLPGGRRPTAVRAARGCRCRPLRANS